jgi:hypothetical protein
VTAFETLFTFYVWEQPGKYLGLTKHHYVKTCEGTDGKLYAFLTSALDSSLWAHRFALAAL